jgi:Fe-S-cluster containining protein
MKSLPLAIENADTATFECTFGRGCDGICCRNGRPSIGPEERKTIEAVLPRALPLLRPEARAVIEADGMTSARTKIGQPMLRVAAGWCVFFNAGCVLHAIGAEDGDSYRYKPTQCALFPLENEKGAWYVRQWGHAGEDWDLFCLNPKNSKRPAVESLAAEITLAAKLEAASE